MYIALTSASIIKCSTKRRIGIKPNIIINTIISSIIVSYKSTINIILKLIITTYITINCTTNIIIIGRIKRKWW
jgi:hypothetical protein